MAVTLRYLEGHDDAVPRNVISAVCLQRAPVAPLCEADDTIHDEQHVLLFYCTTCLESGQSF